MDVLVVDPGELGELLATLLKQYGFSAACVGSGEAALAEALERRPAVVVIEAELPDTSGIDLAELLRDELGSKAIVTYPPSLFTDDPTAAPRLQRLDGAFVRPFRSLSLIETVSQLLMRAVARSVVDRGNDDRTPPPLSSTEGYPIEELTEELTAELTEDLAGEGIEIILSEEHVDADGEPFVLEDFDPNSSFAEDDPTVPAGSKSNRSTEAARPLDEVMVAEQRRQTQTFSMGDLAELWQGIKTRRSSTKPASKPSTGTLTPRLLADLLDAFHQSQTTGELWLGDTQGPGRRVLLLRRGMLVGARSNIEGEDLISLLKKRKAISDEDADDVTFMLSQKLYRSAAEAVLELEHVPERTLRSVVEEHVRRVAIGAFSWTRGRYHLSLEGRATKEAVFADVHVGDIVVHAIVLTESDEALRRAAPDDARFAPVGDAVYGLGHLKLSPAEARVVIAMDGTKTIGDLLTLFDSMPERTVRGLAAGLFCLHLTRLAGRGAASARKISFF